MGALVFRKLSKMRVFTFLSVAIILASTETSAAPQFNFLASLLGYRAQHCRWSGWSWQSCSKPCGGGFRRGTRTILRYPRYGGNQCRGPSEQYQPCNSYACPVHEPVYIEHVPEYVEPHPAPVYVETQHAPTYKEEPHHEVGYKEPEHEIGYKEPHHETGYKAAKNYNHNYHTGSCYRV